MGLLAKSKGTKINPVPAGVYEAICYGVFDLGTHYQDKFKKTQRKVALVFELPEERIRVEKEGKMLDMPRAISKTYSLSLHEKSSLRKDIESWQGKKFTVAEEKKGYDLQTLLGKNAMLQIFEKESNGKTVNVINSLMCPRKGAKVFSPENDIAFFSFDDLGCEIPSNVPNWIKDEILGSEEYKDTIANNMVEDLEKEQKAGGDDNGAA